MATKVKRGSLVAKRPAEKAAQKSAPKKKVVAAKKAIPKKKATTAKKKAVAPKKPPARKELDFSAFPPESIVHSERWLCLACVVDVFTRHMGISATTAHREIKRYLPTLEELNVAAVTRPYFTVPAEGRCPYCGASSKRYARLSIHR